MGHNETAAGNPLTIKGRALALDLGSVRIGVALSDPTQTIAQPHSVLQRGSRQEDFAAYGRIIAEQAVSLLVIGLPLALDGSDSPQTAWVRDYAAAVAEAVAVPVVLWDETFSTVKAQDSLRQRGKRGKRARQNLDAEAAAFILQGFLDARDLGVP